MNTCTLCLTEKPLSDFEPNAKMRGGYLNQCRKCKYQRRVATAEGRARKQATHRRWKIKALYGLSEERYDQMFEAQSGLCAICHRPERDGKRLAIDHDHESGAVRSLLCGNCNIMLGGAEDNQETLQQAIAYLQVHSEGGANFEYLCKE